MDNADLSYAIKVLNSYSDSLKPEMKEWVKNCVAVLESAKNLDEKDLDIPYQDKLIWRLKKDE